MMRVPLAVRPKTHTQAGKDVHWQKFDSGHAHKY